MSNSFYHKDLTDAQWSRIKFLFEKLVIGQEKASNRVVARR